MGRNTWGIVPRKSLADHNLLPVTWYFKFNRKLDCIIRKFKEQYCVREDVQNILSPEPLNPYYPVVQWETVMLVLIFQCIIGL